MIVSRRYIDVCYCDMFSVVNVYLDHLKFCGVCINSRRYVCCSECTVISIEYNEPTSCLVKPISTYGGEVLYVGCVCFRGKLGFLNCDDICMCVVNKQFELLEFVFDSVYADLQYDENSLTSTAGYVSLCWVWGIVLCTQSCGRRWYVCKVVVVPYVDAMVDVTDVCTLVCVACLYAERV